MFEPTSTFEAPSTSQLTALRRAPAIETDTVLARPIPTSSGSDELTPGTSVASWTKLRLLRGSSWTWTGPMRVCTAGVDCTRPAGATISTVASSPATGRVTLTVTRSFTCRAIPRLATVWNPRSAKERS